MTFGVYGPGDFEPCSVAWMMLRRGDLPPQGMVGLFFGSSITTYMKRPGVPRVFELAV